MIPKKFECVIVEELAGSHVMKSDRNNIETNTK